MDRIDTSTQKGDESFGQENQWMNPQQNHDYIHSFPTTKVQWSYYHRLSNIPLEIRIHILFSDESIIVIHKPNLLRSVPGLVEWEISRPGENTDTDTDTVIRSPQEYDSKHTVTDTKQGETPSQQNTKPNPCIIQDQSNAKQSKGHFKSKTREEESAFGQVQLLMFYQRLVLEESLLHSDSSSDSSDSSEDMEEDNCDDNCNQNRILFSHQDTMSPPLQNQNKHQRMRWKGTHRMKKDTMLQSYGFSNLFLVWNSSWSYYLNTDTHRANDSGHNIACDIHGNSVKNHDCWRNNGQRGKNPKHNQDSTSNRNNKNQMYDDLFIVHRLDCETSGVMVFARSNHIASILSQSWRERNEISKTYIAKVKSWPPYHIHGCVEGRIDLPMAPSTTERLKWVITSESLGGKPSTTLWKVVSHDTNPTLVTDGIGEEHRSSNSVLLQLTPVTGRTHQLRVHCAAIGSGIDYDSLYGDSARSDSLDWMLSSLQRKSTTERANMFQSCLRLHSESLSFPHPKTGKRVTFFCPKPW